MELLREHRGPECVPDKDARLWVEPKTDSVDSFGEGNNGTGESGARTASIEVIVVKRDGDTGAAAPLPKSPRSGFAASIW